MPRRVFDKKTSTTYALVHRPQHDPLIHDENAPSQVFKEISGPSVSSKVKRRSDLEEEFDLSLVRPNEGEAAEYGIFYDDSKYDYMQHLRELGSGTDATWVEAPSSHNEKLRRTKDLADALREVSLDSENAASEGGVSLVESTDVRGYNSNTSKLRKATYQSQQDVPDALAGFQPDMDPRLREVLEALDDEAYVDEEDDIFTELTGKGSQEVDQDEWEFTRFDDEAQKNDEDGWESDDTTKPTREYNTHKSKSPKNQASSVDHGYSDTPVSINGVETATDGEWLAEFAKSKSVSVKLGVRATRDGHVSISDSTASTSNPFTRKKKRKGALTSISNYSMTSSALARTEPLSTLDDRFDQIADLYMEDDLDDDGDDGVSLASAATGISTKSHVTSSATSPDSQPPQLMPIGFDAMLDDFLSSSGGATRKQGRKVQRGQTGMDQWDEFRTALGPAHLRLPRR